MSARPGAPGHFGPPRELTEVRLFGRYTLWTRYTWKRVDKDPFDDALPGIIGGVMQMLGIKEKVKPVIDTDASGPIDDDGKVKP